MTSITLVYVRSLSVGGLLLRAAQWWAQWTHVGVVTPDGTVINARAFHGVVEEDQATFLRRYSKAEFVAVPVPDPPSGIEWARSRVGNGYDYGALVRLVTSKLGVDQSARRDECVEVAEGALAHAGRARFRVPASRLTVQQSYVAL
jgi:uncharacterized protein YycO